MSSDGPVPVPGALTRKVRLIKASSVAHMEIHMLMTGVELNAFRHQQMWQVLYLQMSSSVPGVSFQGGPRAQMGSAKKVEVIYFSRQAAAVRKPHGHLLQGTAREGNKQLWRNYSEPMPNVGKESQPV